MSLSRFVDDASDEETTLTVFTDDEESYAELGEFFGAGNVRLRRGTVEGTGPTEFAVLHRGEDAVAVSGLSEVRHALLLGEDPDLLPGDRDGTPGTPEVVRSLGTTTFSVDAEDRPVLARIATHVDELAYGAGEGTLHSGIRRVSALVEDAATMSRYRRLAEAGVETHVYGEYDADPPTVPRVSVHPEGADEISTARFEVFEAPDDGRGAALVAIERGGDSFRGFWTFEPDLVDEVAAYLRATYIEA